MAFGCTFDPESDEFFDWLMRNGYPELGALSRTIQGDTDAKDWLMNHGFPQLAAIDSVIDKEEKAAEWLLKNHFEVDLAFAKAINSSAVLHCMAFSSISFVISFLLIGIVGSSLCVK